MSSSSSSSLLLLFAVALLPTASPLLLLAGGAAGGFGVSPILPAARPRPRPPVSSSSSASSILLRRRTAALRASDRDGGAPDGGMEDAFKQLDDLKSLGDGELLAVPDRKVQDEAFAKAMDQLDLMGLEEEMANRSEPPTPEAEAALYSGMAEEVGGSSEIDLVDGLKAELGGSRTTIPKFDPKSRETERFLERALDEAIEEAQASSSSSSAVDKDSLLDNKEIMKEVEAIFEKANEDLLEGLEEIRKEQTELAKSSAERTSKASEDRIRQDEARLELAEANMKKMLEKVNAETRNVESAIEDLRSAQEEMGGGMDGRLLDLKKGGLVKQGSLVGALLFAIRALTEGIAIVGGAGDDPGGHLLPAIVQGGIALACCAIYALAK